MKLIFKTTPLHLGKEGCKSPKQHGVKVNRYGCVVVYAVASRWACLLFIAAVADQGHRCEMWCCAVTELCSRPAYSTHYSLLTGLGTLTAQLPYLTHTAKSQT